MLVHDGNVWVYSFYFNLRSRKDQTMSNLDLIKSVVIRGGSKALLVGKKYAPDALVGVGVIGIIATAVLASKATLKLSDVISENEDLIEKVESTRDRKTEEEYPTKDYELDKLKVKAQFLQALIRLYGPAALVGLASIAAFLGAHGIMRYRNTALASALAMAEQAFKKYRERVVDKYGPEQDQAFLVGGNVKAHKDGTKSVIVEDIDLSDIASQYARQFDSSNPNWQRGLNPNLHFLKCQENYANDKLRAKGHLFLNEVYESLGFPGTDYGQIVGWIYDSERGDGYVDFGVFSTKKAGKNLDREEMENFGIFLDFNVDGVCWDEIR